MIDAVSFHGFAGAFAVALKNVGVPLRAVIEPGGFGVPAIEANRGVLGFTGPIDASQWPKVYDADLLVGNPPCSGFSLLNTSKTARPRGPESSINDCMWAFARYASEMNNGTGPKIAIFESVQGAGKQGQSLMQQLVEMLARETGEPYVLHNVFMSGASVGSAQLRKRYFWVAAKVPFGLETPKIERVATYQDAIGDLEGLVVQKEAQPYVADATWWSEPLRREDGLVADHYWPESSWATRAASVAHHWKRGETQRHAIAKAIKAGHEFSGRHWENVDPQYQVDRPGFSNMVRVYPNEPGRVITGSGGVAYLHYSEGRTLTVRETARLMGFPDWFDWGFTSGSRAYSYLGKQVPVQSWEWIIRLAVRAIEGDPAGWRPRPREDGAVYFDVTHDYKRLYHERRKEHGVDSRSREWVAAMASRGA